MEKKKFTFEQILNHKLTNLFSFIIRLFLAFLFIYAALTKIYLPVDFANAIDSYQIVPNWLINFFAIVIPWFELFIAFGILFKYKYKENLLLYSFLMMIFSTFIVIAMLKGLDIECGCFGENSTKVGLKKLIENIGIIILSLFLLIQQVYFDKIKEA